MRPTPRYTYRVVFLLLQLSLLLLLPLGLHLHGLGDQVSQDGDWFGLADERVLTIGGGQGEDTFSPPDVSLVKQTKSLLPPTCNNCVAVALCSGLLTRHFFTKSVNSSDQSSGFLNVGGGLVGIMKIAWEDTK